MVNVFSNDWIVDSGASYQVDICWQKTIVWPNHRSIRWIFPQERGSHTFVRHLCLEGKKLTFVHNLWRWKNAIFSLMMMHVVLFFMKMGWDWEFFLLQFYTIYFFLNLIFIQSNLLHSLALKVVIPRTTSELATTSHISSLNNQRCKGWVLLGFSV